MSLRRRGHVSKRCRATVVALLAVLSVARGGAQEPGSPLFLLEPGMISIDFLSAPSDVPASSTGFNLRFETRIPTGTRWLTPVIGASITPYGRSGIGNRVLNTPLLFAGNVFPIVGSGPTRGWATVEAPILLYYSYRGAGEANRRFYGRDLFAQLALRIHLGQKALADLGGFWSRIDVYAFLEQNLTPNATGVSETVDRFNPVGLFGLVIPFGSTPRGR